MSCTAHPVAPPHHDCIGCPYATASELAAEVSALGGRLVVRPSQGDVLFDGVPHHFPGAHRRMLAALAKRAGSTVSHNHLIMALDSKSDDELNTMKAQLCKMRKRLAATAPWLQVVTDFGIGARLVLTEPAPQ